MMTTRWGYYFFSISLNLTSLAIGYQEDQRFYVDLNGGYFMFTDEDAEVSDNGPAFGVDFGYRLNYLSSLEISYLGSVTSGDVIVLADDPTDPLGDRVEEIDFSTNLFFVGFRLSGWSGLDEDHELYLRGGVGGGFVKASLLGESSTTSGFATELGLGYLYHGDRFALGPLFLIHVLENEESSSLFMTPLLTLTASF